MEIVLLLLQYVVVPILCVWIISSVCIKSAKEFERDEQLRVDNQN